MYGFSFDGRHSDEFGLRVFEVVRDILPPTRDYEVEIPGRHGVWDFGADFGKRMIEVDCGFIARDDAELQEKVRAAAEWLNPLKGLRPLIIDDEPDRYWLARYAGQARLETILGFGRVTLPFVCPDPHAYALVDDVFTATGPGSYQFNRKGTATSYPKIEIEGMSGGGSDKITITLNGKTLNYSGTLATGETLVFDSDTITAYKTTTNGQVSVINDIDSIDFPVAVPGANNLTVSTSGGATVNKITVTCRSRWY